MFNKFLTAFLTRTVAPRRRGHPARRNSPLRRLKLEFLENRLTLSGSPVLVTSSADSGAGSLRAAIGSAVSGETIEFAPYVHAITLTSGDLVISQNLDIEGPGACKLTISGNDASRVFDITKGATVTISDLKIADGMVDTPLESSPNINIATWGGGGILNEAGATLTLVNDTLSNNQAAGVVGQDEFGGGLFNMGAATVVACAFTNNQVLGAGSGDAIGGSAGGAIDNYHGATLTVADSLFSNDSVVSADGAGYYALGGAIENNAGVDGSSPSTATLTDCKFLGNLAQAGVQAISNGGAILCEGPGTSMTLTGCLIRANRSVGGAGAAGVETGQGIGGGIMNYLGNMVIADCTIADNQAVGGNLAIASDFGTEGAAFGGGIENNTGVLHMANSIISGNIAQGGANASGPGCEAFGGGIDCTNTAALTATDCLISNNSAIAGPGGAGTAIGTPGVDGVGFGGGINTVGNATTTLVDCTISANVAQGSAGTNGNNGGDGLGGALGVGGFALGGTADNSQLTAIGCTIVRNQAVGGTGGQGADGGDGLGGGLFILIGASATLTDSSVTFNVALGGEEGQGQGGSDGQGVGGGGYVFSGGTLNVDATDYIMKNFASTRNNNIGP
jgi:hypothetical protein